MTLSAQDRENVRRTADYAADLPDEDLLDRLHGRQYAREYAAALVAVYEGEALRRMEARAATMIVGANGARAEKTATAGYDYDHDRLAIALKAQGLKPDDYLDFIPPPSEGTYKVNTTKLLATVKRLGDAAADIRACYRRTESNPRVKVIVPDTGGEVTSIHARRGNEND